MTVMEAVTKELDQPVNADIAMDDLPVDSLEYIELIRNVEQIFSVEIEEEDLEDVVTLGDFCRVVDSLRKAN